ncbi:hypothetical protein J6590_046527 [Homalodisca vitripennis]|nr:hypothetical protein J6590_046527 [Homalodisca vitripennis]
MICSEKVPRDDERKGVKFGEGDTSAKHLPCTDVHWVLFACPRQIKDRTADSDVRTLLTPAFVLLVVPYPPLSFFLHLPLVIQIPDELSS